MKNKLYMLVGIPGSGKSTIAKNLDAKIFSSDDLRKEFWGDENIQGDNNLLFEELHKRIVKSLKNNEDCVYDATNLSSKRRIQFLKLISDIDCEKICILVVTDYELCLRRNKERERKVPESVIKNMYKSIEIPSYREGWDDIRVIVNKIEDKDYDMIALVDRLTEIPHDNPHHLLSIGDHIIAVTKYIVDNYSLIFAGDSDRLYRLICAAFSHDIGKEFTKTFFNTKGEETDVAHYYRHENVSAYMYLLYEDSLNIKLDTKTVLYIADLIQLHMKMHAYNEEKSKVLERMKKIVDKEEFIDLYILNQADEKCG